MKTFITTICEICVHRCDRIVNNKNTSVNRNYPQDFQHTTKETFPSLRKRIISQPNHFNIDHFVT